jgi:hypothetical protein
VITKRRVIQMNKNKMLITLGLLLFVGSSVTSVNLYQDSENANDSSNNDNTIQLLNEEEPPI